MRKNPIKEASFTAQKEAFFREISAVCKWSIKMLLLKVKEETVAIQVMFVHDKSVMVYISGYDREKCPNAGTYLLMAAIKDAIEEGYQQFDFLRGKEPYKYELGAKDFTLYSISAVL